MTDKIQSCCQRLWLQKGGKTQFRPYNQYIKKHYDITVDWNDEIVCGINFEWDYNKKTVYIYVTNYFNKSLASLNHYPPIKPQHNPHTYHATFYYQKREFVIPTITNNKLNPTQLNNCQ